MLTTTMVAVPGPTCYPDLMHHQLQPEPLAVPPQQSLPSQSVSQPTQLQTLPQEQQQEQNFANLNSQQLPASCSNSLSPLHQNQTVHENQNHSGGVTQNHIPQNHQAHSHPTSQQLPPLQQHPPPPPPPPLLHQQPPPNLPLPLNHTSLSNTTLTSSTSIPVVTSTIEMAGPPHQYNPNQPPPPYCPPEYYGGEYYPGPPPDYCPATHMCALHGVPPGPATVRMVSTNSSPPIALPVQVPPGHVVQQIVDENGTLQHVILSSQLPMSVCYHGGNGAQPGPPQFYGPPPHPGNPPPQGYVASYQPSPPQYSPVMTPPPLTQPSPPPHNYQKQDRHSGRQFDKPRQKFYSRPQQQQQQQQQISQQQQQHYGQQHQQQLQQQQQQQQHQQHQQQLHSRSASNTSLLNTPPLSPKKDDGCGKGRSEEEQSDDVSGGSREDYEAALAGLLTQLPPVEITNITARSATLHWKTPPLHLLQHPYPTSQSPIPNDAPHQHYPNNGGHHQPELQQHHTNNNNHYHNATPPGSTTPNNSGVICSPSDLVYEVFLNGGLVTTVTGGTTTTLHNLRPGAEYSVYLWVSCGPVRGVSQCAEYVFYTHSTVPEQPAPIRLTNKTKASLHLKWMSPRDGGSRITAYVLELLETGPADAPSTPSTASSDLQRAPTPQWREVYRGRSREFSVTKLSPATSYRIRLAAINQNGPSEWSSELVCSTLGVPPPQQAPPALERAGVSSLTLHWPRSCPAHSYVLKMEDSLNGYGFIPVYRGPENGYECIGLRRNSDYKFRLAAENDEGSSPLSDIACYRTLPELPGAPTPPAVKGRPRTHYLRLCWSPPSDHGGSCITQYRLTIDKGQGFDVVYVGEQCECDCHELVPGTSYLVRAQAISAGGEGPWSKVNTVTTEPVAPHQCRPPQLAAKPKANVLQLKWDPAPCDGGSPVTEYNLEMVSPDCDRRLVYTGRDTDCTVASLLPGRPYVFLLRAVNRVGPGQWSEPLEAVSGAGPPDAPKCPQLACRSPHIVTAHWEEPINNGAKIESYTVEVAEVSLSHPESSESSSTCGDSELAELTFSPATTATSTTADVRHLQPDTTYAVRVCGTNNAGVGPFSGHSVVTTPPSAPSPPPHISATTTSSSVTLHWTEPKCNGDPVLSYIVEVVDTGATYNTGGPVLEFTVPDLEPDTSYRVRVQAVNGVGVGGFSASHKCQTRSLPPAPPALELVKASYNWLKLSWGDKKQNLLAPEPLTYCLQIEFPNPHNKTKEFYQVYNGTNNAYKLTKLEEATVYRLRICASNQAGVGPNSDPVEFRTTRAPPPAPKAPRASEQQPVSESSPAGVLIEWCPVRCFNDDPVSYVLQTKVATRVHEFTTVYTGPSTSFMLQQLTFGALYNVRVCGVRHCSGGGEELTGAYSSATVFNAPKAPPAPKQPQAETTTQQRGGGSVLSRLSWHRVTDSQKATVSVFFLTLLAVLLAYVLYGKLNP